MIDLYLDLVAEGDLLECRIEAVQSVTNLVDRLCFVHGQLT